MTHSGLGRSPTERGQATVELALSLPLVFLGVLTAVQVLVVTRDQIAVIHAAREGARAAAVASVPAAEGRAAAREAAGLDGPLAIDVDAGADTVRVTVRYVRATTVPLVGALVGDVTVTGTAVMRREP